jgi:hypothetical protein
VGRHGFSCRRFRESEEYANLRNEVLAHLPQTRPSTGVELYIDTGVSSAERGAARFGGGNGAEHLLWAAHQACGGVPAG